MGNGSGDIRPERFDAAGYRRFRRGEWSGWLAPGFEAAPELLPELAETGRIVKNRPKTLAAVNGKLFIKISRHRGLWRRLRYNFRRPRPLRTLEGALRLAALGVATPAVLATLRRRRHFMVRCDLLVTAALPEETLFLDRYFHLLSPEAAEAAATAAVELLARMHAGGFEHGDLNLRNLYRVSGGDGEPLRLGVIDLDGCRLSEQPLEKKRRRRELARLASSFMREERSISPAEQFDPAERGEWFAAKYFECSGINLAGGALTDRIGYLADRTRK